MLTAFGFDFRRVERHEDMAGALRDMLAVDGPAAMEVMIDPDQTFAPKLSSRRLEDGTMVSSPLEDMHPFLSREELADNMLVAPMPV